MSPLQRLLASAPRLVLLLANEKQREQAIVLYSGTGQVAYSSLELALDALRSEAPK